MPGKIVTHFYKENIPNIHCAITEETKVISTKIRVSTIRSHQL